MRPTENPTCKHCGQKESEHSPHPTLLGKDLLVCPFATFEAQTETNLSGQRNSTSREEVVAEYPNKAGMPAQNLSPAQEKLCEEWARHDSNWTTERTVRGALEWLIDLRRKLDEAQSALGKRTPEPPE